MTTTTKFPLPLLLLAFNLLAFNGLQAQCNLNPTIQNGDIILCPDESATLTIADTFDTYQWLREGQPIAGATGPTLEVNQFDDGGYPFSVRVTEGACVDTSAEIFVDGWAFLPPFVITEGNFTIGPNGETIFCEGDTAFLTLGLPYTENITWYRNDQPIPGENDPLLVVTTPGAYYVSGAPAQCPDFIQTLGVIIEVQVTPNPQPMITATGNVLHSNVPGAAAYLWMLDGQPIPNSDAPTYTATQMGTYTVTTFTAEGCSRTSAPFFFQPSGVEEPVAAAVQVFFQQEMLLVKAQDLQSARAFDAQGRQVLFQEFENEEVGQMNAGALPAGAYLVQVELSGGKTALRRVARL